ncbi:MAG TPA: DUF1294 domain-containing protein [Tepidisphaeraceae bacterium]|jgi:uncharacterized membrane protein YsdA (DUF1294 family)|nr:DUF1294 domain-containing protein [Tepidisphaeraceae bacterium]
MRSKHGGRRSPFRFFLVLSLLVGAATAWLLYARAGWLLAAAYLGGVNLATACAYLYDKFAAVRGYGRIPERLLHVLAACGGTPAALVSQIVFRHKTIKRSFRTWFWAIFAVQLAALAAWAYFWWGRSSANPQNT